jgi:YtfJ family uncharacterized protein
MAKSRLLLGFILALMAQIALPAAPAVDAPLPLLKVSERGELTMSGEDFKFVPWSSESNPGTVHVLQYFGATLGDRDVFKPFTDLLQTSFEPGAIHVTTVLNLDAALWGTTGFVISELEKNKKKHPKATMVLDDNGDGITTWDLGEAGTALFVTDDKGIVKFFSRESLNEEEMQATVELIQANIGG